MDRFDTMLAFTRVVELGSFTKAALSLNIPKATLSTQVASLEKRLNVKLFHRTTRQVSPTTDGTVYYERAMRLLNDLEETEAAVSQANLSYRGRLRVDTSGTICRQIILPAIKDFFQRYPEIELELGSTDRTVDLLQEGIDCAIRGGMPIDESLVARKLVETRLVTCASPTYLEQHGTPVDLQELQSHFAVNFLSPRTGKIAGFRYELNGKNVEMFGPRRIALNDIDACVSAALADIGIAQLPYFSVRNHLKSGQLVRILTQYPGEIVTAYAVYLQNRHLSANVRAFIDWTIKLFEKEQQDYFNCCPLNSAGCDSANAIT
jgi:LysR family transcriptional regulator for bpeEF and oprC